MNHVPEAESLITGDPARPLMFADLHMTALRRINNLKDPLLSSHVGGYQKGALLETSLRHMGVERHLISDVVLIAFRKAQLVVFI